MKKLRLREVRTFTQLNQLLDSGIRIQTLMPAKAYAHNHSLIVRIQPNLIDEYKALNSVQSKCWAPKQEFTYC